MSAQHPSGLTAKAMATWTSQPQSQPDPTGPTERQLYDLAMRRIARTAYRLGAQDMQERAVRTARDGVPRNHNDWTEFARGLATAAARIEGGLDPAFGSRDFAKLLDDTREDLGLPRMVLLPLEDDDA